MKKILSLLCAAILLLGVAGYASAGEYYMYANFDSSDGYLGGADVDSYGDYLYVNHNGNRIDRYTVTTAAETATQNVDTTLGNIGPDGVVGPTPVGPDQILGTADDNTADDNNGPMLVRTLTFDLSYTVPAIGGRTVSEIYAIDTGLYFLNGSDDISFYDFSSGITTSITAASDLRLSQLARSAGGTWYASNESNDIYRYDGGSWTHIIDHTVTLGGGHLDGLEVVSLDVTADGIYNPEEWIFAADMTSDFMTRYSLGGTLEEVYSYNGAGMYLEGMGFGANNHFWATTSYSNLYEIGGGAFTGSDDDDQQPVPEPSTILLMGAGLVGLAGWRKRKLSKK